MNRPQKDIPDQAPPVGASAGQRAVRIEGDAVGNVLITGDGNVLVIQQEAQERIEIPREPEPIGPNPYKGLAFFDEQDADRFFGREALTRRLWDKLHKLQSPPPNADPPVRLLPVLGPSGSGKSSLVRAGLIPELARRPLPGWSKVQVAVFTPGPHPNEALAGVLARLATGDRAPVAKTREFHQELLHGEGGHDGLRRIADALLESDIAPLVLVVDQFEGIYTQYAEDARKQEAFVARRNAFIGNLLHAAGELQGRVSVVLALRSDFLGATKNLPDLNRLIAAQGEIVPVMSQDELRQAITAPAAQAGHPFDEATVDLLVDLSRGREGTLPLLQFALTQIWEGLARGVEPAETLREIGGVSGALAQRAQQLYDNLGSEANQRIARRAFLRMVSLGEEGLYTVRRAPLSEIVAAGEDPQQVRNVLEAFARPDERLITLLGSTTPDDEDEVHAEVIHEVLFEQWAQLRRWLEESRENIRFHRRLVEAARHWDANGRPRGLLWEPPDLDQLRRFKDLAAQDMTAVEMDFYQASENRLWWVRVLKWTTAGALVLLTLFAPHQCRQAVEARQEAIHELVNASWVQGRNQWNDKNNPLKQYFRQLSSLLGLMNPPQAGDLLKELMNNNRLGHLRKPF